MKYEFYRVANKKALIVASGSIGNLSILKNVEDEYDFILAADGGANHLLNAGIYPNIIIGDLDSISKDILEISKENNIAIEEFPVKKDASDTELSIDYLIDKGYREVDLMGVTGSRMDHTLGNILLLNKLLEKDVKGKIIDGSNIIYLVDDSITLDRKVNHFVSIIPISDFGAVLTLKGFEYELNKGQVDFSSTQAISNSIKEDRGCILVHSGLCLVIISKD